MKSLENQSVYQVLEGSQSLSKNQLLQSQVKKLTQKNASLQSQNKLLKDQFINKEVFIRQLEAKTRELSKALMQLSRGMIANQDLIAQKSNEIVALNLKITQYQAEKCKFTTQKEDVQRLLKEITILFNKSKEENQKLTNQLKRFNQNKELQTVESVISQKQKLEKRLRQYKSLAKKESEKNLALQVKLIDLQTQLTIQKKQQNNQKKQFRKIRSDIRQ